MEPNLILVGFMGTGKSAVGQEVARRMRRDFVDMDERIATQVGKSIPQIFAEDGEAAFREWEHRMCTELGMLYNQVISCGGGVVLHPSNLTALQQNGVLICLTATPEVILQRIRKEIHRPLLFDETRPSCSSMECKIRDLLTERKSLYAKIALQVDTSEVNIAQAADRVEKLFQRALRDA